MIFTRRKGRPMDGYRPETCFLPFLIPWPVLPEGWAVHQLLLPVQQQFPGPLRLAAQLELMWWRSRRRRTLQLQELL